LNQESQTMFKDEHKRSVWNTLRQHDLQPLNKILTPALVSEAAKRCGMALGAGPLNAFSLVWLSLLGAVEKGRNFAGILQMALKLLHDQQAWSGTPSPAFVPKSARGVKSAGHSGSGKKKLLRFSLPQEARSAGRRSESRDRRGFCAGPQANAAGVLGCAGPAVGRVF
jgi:hypothetical protein